MYLKQCLILQHMSAQDTPEAQVAAANVWELFRFVQFRGEAG